MAHRQARSPHLHPRPHGSTAAPVHHPHFHPRSWWHAYSSRKMTVPEEEYAANQLLYDPTHLPGSPAAAAATPPAK